MSTRPTTIDVCGRTYKVKATDLSEYRAMGLCDGDLGYIHIDPVACSTVCAERDTVLHEALHAVFRQQGREYTKAEERFVTALAPGLLAVIRHNPRLIRYLTAP